MYKLLLQAIKDVLVESLRLIFRFFWFNDNKAKKWYSSLVVIKKDQKTEIFLSMILWLACAILGFYTIKFGSRLELSESTGFQILSGFLLLCWGCWSVIFWIKMGVIYLKYPEMRNGQREL